MTDCIIKDTTLIAIAEEVRQMFGLSNQLSTAEILSYLKQENSNIQSALQAIKKKGVIIPSNSHSNNLATLINQIIEFPLAKVEWTKGTLYAPEPTAEYTVSSYPENGINFYFTGKSGTEQLVFPISNLRAGYKYKLSFTENYNGSYITPAGSYQYGCGFLTKAVYDSYKLPTNKGQIPEITWTTRATGTQSGTLTFTADATTGYWMWALSDISDSHKELFKFTANIAVQL